MNSKLLRKIPAIRKNVLVKNSYWGLVSHFSQVALTSLFFVIIARKYSTTEFANYIIATVLYQLISSFSSLGLSQWFIREITTSSEKESIVNKFVKAQLHFGLLFYIINIIVAYLIYGDNIILSLTIIIGINVVFDNLINTIKSLNIADFQQKKTFVILTIEAFLKFLAVCLLYIYPFTIITLSIITVVLRFVTLNLFLKFGSSGRITIRGLWSYKISLKEIKNLVFINWPFLIIGSLSIINWRVSNIIISKVLTATDVANYEVSYKIFSIAQLLPVIISATFFPSLVRLYKDGDMKSFLTFYKRIHVFYSLFGIVAYTFIYSFADFLVPLVFGANYGATSVYTKQMFLTILVFPTAFLQANLLTAMKLEKTDMWLNVFALLTNFIVCFIGLHYLKSLLIINLSIFLSFAVFHVLQDYVLIKRKVSSLGHASLFYIITALIVLSYVFLSNDFNPYYFFICFWIMTLLALLYGRKAGNYISILFLKRPLIISLRRKSG